MTAESAFRAGVFVGTLVGVALSTVAVLYAGRWAHTATGRLQQRRAVWAQRYAEDDLVRRLEESMPVFFYDQDEDRR